MNGSGYSARLLASLSLSLIFTSRGIPPQSSEHNDIMLTKQILLAPLFCWEQKCINPDSVIKPPLRICYNGLYDNTVCQCGLTCKKKPCRACLDHCCAGNIVAPISHHCTGFSVSINAILSTMNCLLHAFATIWKSYFYFHWCFFSNVTTSNSHNIPFLIQL